MKELDIFYFYSSFKNHLELRQLPDNYFFCIKKDSILPHDKTPSDFVYFIFI